jgi:hypothetical protein
MKRTGGWLIRFRRYGLEFVVSTVRLGSQRNLELGAIVIVKTGLPVS